MDGDNDEFRETFMKIFMEWVWQANILIHASSFWTDCDAANDRWKLRRERQYSRLEFVEIFRQNAGAEFDVNFVSRVNLLDLVNCFVGHIAKVEIINARIESDRFDFAEQL